MWLPELLARFISVPGPPVEHVFVHACYLNVCSCSLWGPISMLRMKEWIHFGLYWLYQSAVSILMDQFIQFIKKKHMLFLYLRLMVSSPADTAWKQLWHYDILSLTYWHTYTMKLFMAYGTLTFKKKCMTYYTVEFLYIFNE